MLWRATVLLLAAPSLAGEEEPGIKTPSRLRVDPTIELPAAKHAKKDDGGHDVVVNLDAEGRLSIGDQRATLQKFQKTLKERKDQKRQVLLRIDEGAPSLHARWLIHVCAACKAGIDVRGELLAGRKVPFGVVAGVADVFVATKIEDLRYPRPEKPDDALRGADVLPYPKTNYRTAK